MREWISALREGPLGTATWVDWVDVGLLALAIYATLRVLRGTRAVASLLGLGLLGAVYVLSSLLGLTTLHWLLDNVFVYAVLALLILFQEDIRRVLAQAGGTVLPGGAGAAAHGGVALVEEVVKGTFALAARRIGALVALERGASLTTFSEGGHELGAQVSSELLEAVFHPSSPMHDGAVVISGGRIAWAGVFLPLTLSKTLPQTFGTRHRAAVGLTEKTDAVVVVVSEERGTVSVVEDGRLLPVADPNDLRQVLQERLGARAAGEVGGA